jgi:hypothetical protein
MKGWVRECGFSRELSHFMLTHGSHPLKWQTTHFPLTVAVLYLTGWSGGTGELALGPSCLVPGYLAKVELVSMMSIRYLLICLRSLSWLGCEPDHGYLKMIVSYFQRVFNGHLCLEHQGSPQKFGWWILAMTKNVCLYCNKLGSLHLGMPWLYSSARTNPIKANKHTLIVSLCINYPVI